MSRFQINSQIFPHIITSLNVTEETSFYYYTLPQTFSLSLKKYANGEFVNLSHPGIGLGLKNKNYESWNENSSPKTVSQSEILAEIIPQNFINPKLELTSLDLLCQLLEQAQFETQISSEKYNIFFTHYPGESFIDFHTHPVSVLNFILSGEVEVKRKILGEKIITKHFTSGEFFYISKEQSHSLKNKHEIMLLELWENDKI